MNRTDDHEGERSVRVGIVGVGPIGESIALTLVERGHDVVVHDIRAERISRAVTAGARAAASAREAAATRDVVFTALPTSNEVFEAVLDAQHGLLAEMRAPATLIDVTTSPPAAQVMLGQRCAEAGIDFLESPVSGRPPHFAAFVGGDERALTRMRPLLADLSDNIVHLGAVGSGSRAKIVHQLIAFGNFTLACEALAIAARAELPLDPYLSALQRSRASSAMLPLVEHTVLLRDFVDRGGSLAQIAKDMRLVRELAAELGVESSWVSIVTGAFLEAEDSGLGDESAAAVAKIIESRVGSQISSRSALGG